MEYSQLAQDLARSAMQQVSPYGVGNINPNPSNRTNRVEDTMSPQKTVTPNLPFLATPTNLLPQRQKNLDTAKDRMSGDIQSPTIQSQVKPTNQPQSFTDLYNSIIGNARENREFNTENELKFNKRWLKENAPLETAVISTREQNSLGNQFPYRKYEIEMDAQNKAYQTTADNNTRKLLASMNAGRLGGY